jgi:hypothetical protein
MSIESLLRKKAEQQKQLETEKPRLEIVSTITTIPEIPNQPNIGNQPDIDNQPNSTNITNPTQILKSVSPSNDFAKVPNSIVRIAVPERFFKGMSKNTYDALYLKTRGAINPTRKIRATKSDLIRWTGVSDVTIDKHIRHLKSVGLLKVEFVIGSHEGNWYEIFIPEEIKQPNQLNQPSIPNQVGGEVPNLVGEVGGGELIENKEFIKNPNTSLKTNTKNDDEAFAALTEVFAQASEEISGKLPNKNQQENWKELAELLVMELKVASARTASVSNVPAFLTEHLRRRLMPVKRPETKSPTKTNKSSQNSQTGNQQPSELIGQYQAEPLTEQGRESTLKAFAGYMEKGQKEFLLGLEDSYTREDWEWLMKELKIA